MKKTTVIYHSADFDGIFCREIARKFLPDAELIGWNFGDKPLDIPLECTVYVLDLPIDSVFGFKFVDSKIPGITPESTLDVAGLLHRIVWIDHHKSSIESHPAEIPGYRIDGVAACRLAWQWFSSEFGPNNPFCHPVNYALPDKQQYVDRQVMEPWAVRLAGEYDIWDKRDPDAELFQHGLRSRELVGALWDIMLDAHPATLSYDRKWVQELLDAGRAVQYAQQQADASVVKYRSFLVKFEGLKFLALNTARCNSLTFAALDVPETGHDALLGYMFNGKCWTVSLYHAKHRTDIDLSKIATKHGGGGHRGACGFTCEKLPFMP